MYNLVVLLWVLVDICSQFICTALLRSQQLCFQSSHITDLHIYVDARRRRRAKLNASPSIVTSSADVMLVAENEKKGKPRPHIRKKEVMDTDSINSLTETGRKRHLQKMEAESSGYFPCINSETGYYDISRLV